LKKDTKRIKGHYSSSYNDLEFRIKCNNEQIIACKQKIEHLKQTKEVEKRYNVIVTQKFEPENV